VPRGYRIVGRPGSASHPTHRLGLLVSAPSLLPTRCTSVKGSPPSPVSPCVTILAAQRIPLEQIPTRLPAAASSLLMRLPSGSPHRLACPASRHLRCVPPTTFAARHVPPPRSRIRVCRVLLLCAACCCCVPPPGSITPPPDDLQEVQARLSDRKIGVSVSPSGHSFDTREWERPAVVRASPSYFNTGGHPKPATQSLVCVCVRSACVVRARSRRHTRSHARADTSGRSG
jgi:hypothetical protein